MRKLFAVIAVFASLLAIVAQAGGAAPNVAGTWQAMLPVTPQGIRMVVRITRATTGGWNATMFVDNTNPIHVDSVTVGRSTLELIGNVGRYQGEISADGTSIRGIWIHGNPRPLDPPLALELRRATRHTAWSLPPDPSPHITRYVTVDKDTNLEALDWGGSGRPVVLLGGLGSNAHVFDLFAPKLTPRYHVYGITRRGFDNSTAPLSGYSADRLGDDVLAVIDALHLDRPVLVGHSIAGEELSSVGSRYPQRVAGLIYLDAGYVYAYYDRAIAGDGLVATVDIDELQRRLDQLKYGDQPADPSAVIQQVLNTELPSLTQSLLAWQRILQATPAASREAQSSAPLQRLAPVAQDIEAGLQRYTRIPVPILAIFAPAGGAQADAFEKGVPSAHVVRLPQASHEVFRSNEADVLREMDAFIGGLPQ